MGSKIVARSIIALVIISVQRNNSIVTSIKKRWKDLRKEEMELKSCEVKNSSITTSFTEKRNV